jgi:hypothetical protein
MPSQAEAARTIEYGDQKDATNFPITGGMYNVMFGGKRVHPRRSRDKSLKAPVHHGKHFAERFKEDEKFRAEVHNLNALCMYMMAHSHRVLIMNESKDMNQTLTFSYMEYIKLHSDHVTIQKGILIVALGV